MTKEKSRGGPSITLFLIVIAAAVACLGALPSTAFAGHDYWSCTSTLGTPCVDLFEEFEQYVVADYTGSGDLPLLAGSYCKQAGCGGSGYIFYVKSSDFYPPAYNHIIACYHPISCGDNSPWLGKGHAENRHTSSHTVYGSDGY